MLVATSIKSMDLKGTLDWEDITLSKSTKLPIWTGYHFANYSFSGSTKYLRELDDAFYSICSIISSLLYAILQGKDVFLETAEAIDQFIFDMSKEKLESLLKDYKQLFDDWQPNFPIEMDAGCFTMISPLSYIFMARGQKGIQYGDLTILFPSDTLDELLK